MIRRMVGAVLLVMCMVTISHAQMPFGPYVAPGQYGYNFRPMGQQERFYNYRYRYFNRTYYMDRGGRIYWGY